MVRLRGRHLLDHEALTCLLVLLFVDDPKLNTNRLHRVLRNLCYYTPTRIWVINTLLSVLQRLSDASQETTANVETFAPAERKQPSQSASKEKLKKKSSHHDIVEHGICSTPGTDGQAVDDLPAWLNVYLCAALGSQTNVFRLQKNTKRHHGRGASGGGSTPTPTGISIHPQASALVCRHVLDMLISLAKTFASQFLPELKASSCSGEKDERDVESDDKPRGKDTPSKAGQLSPGKDLVASGVADAAKSHTDFWDLLVKLDCMVSGKKGKSTPRPQAGVFVDCSVTPSCYETSPLGQLMTMLAHPVVRRSHLLTDRLLRLLGLVSGAMPELTTVQAPAATAAPGTAPGSKCSSFAHFNISSWPYRFDLGKEIYSVVP